mgnify:CR=1 FL=1
MTELTIEERISKLEEQNIALFEMIHHLIEVDGEMLSLSMALKLNKFDDSKESLKALKEKSNDMRSSLQKAGLRNLNIAD